MNENEMLDSYLFHRHRRRELEAASASKDVSADADASGAVDELPNGDTLTLYATDGTPLAATLFPKTIASARGPVVIANATGVKQTFYARFASFLAGRGFDVVTFDYRGIGGSRAVGADATMHEWGDRDLAGIVSWAASALGQGRVALVGHSVGGQLVGLLPRPETLTRIVTVGAQIGDYRLWPMPARLAMAALWYGLIPGVTHAVGYLPGALGVGHDLPSGVALEWARWGRTPNGLLSDDADARRARFARVNAEMLAYSFGDDAYAPHVAVDALHAFYENARVTRRRVSRREQRTVGHFGFFRRRFRATLWSEAAGFLANGTQR